MVDLRRLFEDLGYRAVPATATARIEKKLAAESGVSPRITLLTAAELAAAVAENPLLEIADDPSRLLVAILNNAADRAKLKPVADQDWGRRALAVVERVAYLWCVGGIAASPLAAAVGRALGDTVAACHWTTTLKLSALAEDRG